MINKMYKRQVELLLKVLPEVAKERDFALHGGTAINLFIRNMPRLSVDIDLTYIPIEARSESLEKISQALNRIKIRIERIIPSATIQHKEKVGKLIISAQGAAIKLEVNLVSRGLLGEMEKHTLSEKTATEYDAFVVTPVVPFGQLYGGKICAALDRQHPRDLFDVRYLLENEGLSRDVLTGFLLALISNDRPIYEVLKPNLLDQRSIMDNHFLGMTSEPFSYADFEQTRLNLIDLINKALNIEDRKFLLSVKNLTPDWRIYNFEQFPAVRWKLRNLKKLKDANLDKQARQFSLLQEHLQVDLTS